MLLKVPFLGTSLGSYSQRVSDCREKNASVGKTFFLFHNLVATDSEQYHPA